MTRDELVAAVKEAGFDFYTDAQVQTRVDQACAEFQLEELWPWRLTTTTDAAPAIVVDLGEVVSVTMVGLEPLTPVRPSDLEEFSADLATAGTPDSYYIADQDEDGGTVCVYPTSTEDVTVRHYRRRFWATGGRVAASGSDVPLGPAEICEAVELLAVSKCHRLNNNPEGVQLARSEYQIVLDRMRDRELAVLGGVDEPDTVGYSDLW